MAAVTVAAVATAMAVAVTAAATTFAANSIYRMGLRIEGCEDPFHYFGKMQGDSFETL